jgi:hypothetical protein
MGKRRRLGFAGILIALAVGCAVPRDDDDRDRPSPRGAQTIEKMTKAASQKYDIHQAEICDDIADRLEKGEVIDVDKLLAEINKRLGKAHGEDFHTVNKMMQDLSKKERGRYGKREVKIFRAMGEGYRMAAGAAKSDDDEPDEPEKPVRPHRRDRQDDDQQQD